MAAFFAMFRCDEARQLAMSALEASQHQHLILASRFWYWAYLAEKSFRDEENERCK